ncbi:MAG: cache domain-containing protein [Cellulosilyticaceae bacterium]
MATIKNKKKILHIFLYTLLTVLPPTLTGAICQYITITNTAQSTYATLYTLGNNISERILSTANGIDYCMRLLTYGNDFHQLNSSEITQQINLARYYNPRLYNNVVVIDKNNKFIYGVSNEDLQQVSYIQQCVSSGKIVYHYELVSDIPTLKTCYPILKDGLPSNETIGVIVCDLNMDYIDPILSNVNVFGDDIEAYLVDEDGVLISNSRYIPNAKGTVRMDINKIKLSIDYNPYKPFKNYRDKETYGIYFEIPNLNWTLIVTNNVPENSQNVMNTIGYISALSGAGGLGTLEFVKKIKENKQLAASLLESNDDDTPKKDKSKNS